MIISEDEERKKRSGRRKRRKGKGHDFKSQSDSAILTG